MAIGINTDEITVNVVDERTGVVYGVGSNSGSGTRVDNPPRTFILVVDENGEYHLIPK